MIRLTLTLLLLNAETCNEYNILGYEFGENEGFITIYDQDSTAHTYRFIELDEENFCVDHWQYETVSKKNGLHNQETKSK